MFFGGAGVSAPSGIPDFRSPDGLYSQSYKYPPETIISHSFFERNPEEFFRFYRERMVFPDAKPNAAHTKLSQLEREGHIGCVITQNIDGLHTAAGSKNVVELHGSIHRNHCMRCGRLYGLEAVTGSDGVPKCECGGTIKPDVVLYEEALNGEDIERAVDAISRCPLLIVGGTSLVVYPAAGLIEYLQKGAVLAVVNKTPTPADRNADIVIGGDIAEVFGEL